MAQLYFWMASKLACLRNEKGASAVEYGLVVALIAVAIIVGAGLMGTALNTLFTNIATKLGVVVP